MNAPSPAICIETDLFLFEAPSGWQVENLGEQAELIGPNDELLVLSSYEADANSDSKTLDDFSKNIISAMQSAADEPDLVLSDKLSKEVTPNGLPVWKLLAHTTDNEAFFDQYVAISGTTAVLVSVEGDLPDRASSALVEESVYCLEFKA